MIGILTIHFHLHGCASLKEKRSLIKPLVDRLHRQFNVTVAEVDYQDIHQDAVIAVGLINNNTALIHSYMSGVLDWIEKYFPDLMIQDHSIEII
jgi:uncharacterized protein